MTREPEFKDTPTDRAAVAVLLEAAGQPPRDELATMNSAWDELAPRIAASDEETFNRWLDEIEARREGSTPEAIDRAQELVTHLTGWRIGDV